MSILNVHVTDERVLVAVDTNVLNAHTGVMSEASKVLPWPHINTVIALRGPSVFLSELFVAYLLRDLDFDRIVDDLPTNLLGFDAWADFTSKRLQVDRDDLAAVQFVIAGYSKSRSRMSAFHYSRGAADPAFDIFEIKSAILSPATQDPASVASTRKGMLEIGRKQREYGNKLYPGEAIGGRLIVAEITKDRVTIESVGDLSTK